MTRLFQAISPSFVRELWTTLRVQIEYLRSQSAVPTIKTIFGRGLKLSVRLLRSQSQANASAGPSLKFLS